MLTTTTANGGIPAGLVLEGRKRRKAFDAIDGAKGHAAGVLHVAPDGDVLLLRRSNAEANYAGHWALPGGGVEAGETPAQGAARESREEMGVDVDPASLKPLDRTMTPTGMAFHTFVRPVDKKFAPALNDEHSGYAWASLNQLPRPLHPAVERTLQNQVGLADDMAPEDWTALRDGFVKWSLEEELEDEHAEDEIDIAAMDCSLRMALDRDSVRDKDRDGRMRVSLTNLSKATVNPYRGSEIPDWEALGLDPNHVYYLLRDPDELAKAADSFNGVQLLRKHTPVSAQDDQRWDVVGTTGTAAKFEDPYLQNSLHVWSQEAIDDIESEAKKELSCGYHYRADMTPGNFNGMRFDGVMRDIVGNHVALVKDGRAGPDVVVGDSNEEIEMAKTAEARKIDAVAKRTLTVGSLVTYLKPRMAQDSKFEIAPLLAKVPVGPGFTAHKKALIDGIRKVTLAKDANLEDVGKVLDMLEKHEIGEGSEAVDESVSEEQHRAMEAAAHGQSKIGIPEAVGKEFAAKDEFEGTRNYLKEKGMADDDIEHALSLHQKPAATDVDPDLDETPEEKRAREDKEKRDRENEANAKKGEDAMKDMVTKPAMDAAIKLAVDSTAKTVRDQERGIRSALEFVRPYVGELSSTLAFDSADDVYRHAAVTLGVTDAKNIHASALPTLIGLMPKAGARPTDVTPRVAMDAAQVDSFKTMFPGGDRIKNA